MIDGIIDNVDDIGRLLVLKKWRQDIGINSERNVEVFKKGDVLYIVPCDGENTNPSGIKKKVDELGRIVIPKKLRSELGITSTTPLEICKENDRISIQLKAKGCCICGIKPERSEVVLNLHGKIICKKCSNEIIKIKSN